eukprot:3701678-Amphidinium_carterae.1
MERERDRPLTRKQNSNTSFVLLLVCPMLSLHGERVACALENGSNSRFVLAHCMGRRASVPRQLQAISSAELELVLHLEDGEALREALWDRVKEVGAWLAQCQDV